MPRLYRCENNQLSENLPEQINNFKNNNNSNNNDNNDKRGEEKSSSLKSNKNKKLNFKTCKKNTINSLNEVECFLRDFKKISKSIKLYKILK